MLSVSAVREEVPGRRGYPGETQNYWIGRVWVGRIRAVCAGGGKDSVCVGGGVRSPCCQGMAMGGVGTT
jgi:hypothetical protein